VIVFAFTAGNEIIERFVLGAGVTQRGEESAHVASQHLAESPRFTARRSRFDLG
jgi:hypothetical protein